MFNIGDKVKVIKVGTWPVDGKCFSKFINMEGIIVNTFDSFSRPGNIVFSVYFNEGNPINFLAEHLMFWVDFEVSKTFNSTYYPHKCPVCGEPSYVNASEKVDCTNSKCLTKDPGHWRYFTK